MLVHHPLDYPDYGVLEKILPAGKELMIPVEARSQYITIPMQGLGANERNCVLPYEEKKLKLTLINQYDVNIY